MSVSVRNWIKSFDIWRDSRLAFSCCIPAVRSVAVVVWSLQPCNAVYANVFSVIQTGRGARPTSHSTTSTSTSWRTSSSVPSPRWSRLWWLRTKFPSTTGALNFITELLRWFSVWAQCWCVAGKSRVVPSAIKSTRKTWPTLSLDWQWIIWQRPLWQAGI